VYDVSDSLISPCTSYLSGLDWGQETDIRLIGSCRLPDYYTELPVIAGIPSELKPGRYAVLYQTAADSFRLTANPFPFADWFSKQRVLPAGDLSLFNVGDTLVARGYFVPGEGHNPAKTGTVPLGGLSPLSPQFTPASFAALQDGEWRLLTLTEPARNLAGPLCRFTLSLTSGWLEYRHHCFWFYPGELFRWR